MVAATCAMPGHGGYLGAMVGQLSLRGVACGVCKITDTCTGTRTPAIMPGVPGDSPVWRIFRQVIGGGVGGVGNSGEHR